MVSGRPNRGLESLGGHADAFGARRDTLGLDSPPELPRQQRATIRDGGVNVYACLQRVDLFDFLDRVVEGGQRDYLNCVE